MEKKSLQIAKELYDSKIIDDSFFPLDLEKIQNLPENLQQDFDNYLQNRIIKNHIKKSFDINLLPHTQKSVLVIEIGGTKTSVQRFDFNNLQNLSITPLSEVVYIPTIQSTELERKLSSNEFFDWIAKIIKENLADSKLVGMNIATAIDTEGNILITPTNISVENIQGFNLLKELQNRIGEITLKIFNDVESVAAIQLINSAIENFYIDINGTGNNSSVYSNEKYIINLESGHIKCINTKNEKLELEYAVGGRNGIEKTFNDICKKNNLSEKYFTVYEIEELMLTNSDSNLSKLAFLIYERVALYKAVSFICIDKFAQKNNLIKTYIPHFILFGGINKQEKVQETVKKYLKILNSNIAVSYTIYGEDAGRYGAALLTNII